MADGASAGTVRPTTGLLRTPCPLISSEAGALFETLGTGFQVSANLSPGHPVAFGNRDPGYPLIFAAFSEEKLFTAIGSNMVDVVFLIAGTNTPGMTNGFASFPTSIYRT
jgi:hypothetical protein